VQWGTRFATRPDFVPFALPKLSGEAVMPSTVELFVDNALRYSGKVPPGPFELPDAPLVTGQGQAQLVVRDVLGRESVVTQPFHVDARLLRPGLHDFTYEAGFVRRRFGVESNRYGGLFVAGTHRLGLNERLTGELRAELSGRQQTVGAATSYLLPALGLVDMALAVSQGAPGRGALSQLGLSRQGQRWSFDLRLQRATPAFTQLGSDLRPSPRQLVSASLGFVSRSGGSAFLSYVQQAQWSHPAREFVAAGYSVTLAQGVHLSPFALLSWTGTRVYSVGLQLTWALAERATASAAWNRTTTDGAASLAFQQSLPQGNGLGYRLAASRGTSSRDQAAVYLQADTGAYGAEAVRYQGETSYRMSASGGMALIDGHAHLARRLEDGFALVQVEGYAGVPILVDNQPVATTDADGLALVTRLRPYQNNAISIQAQDLPLDAEIGATRLDVSVERRGAAVVRFPVRPARGALLKIVLDSGLPLPAGAELRVEGGEARFPVALRGEAYVTGLAQASRIEASWRGQRCTFAVTLARDAGPLPVIGPLLCSGVRA
jgi:outer membrane usher protein